MEIQKEDHQLHTIQSYTDAEIKIADTTYSKSVIVTTTEIKLITGNDLDLVDLEALDLSSIELVVIGSLLPFSQIPMTVREYFLHKQIGLEIMGIGAACRTFNILLAENRQTIGIFLFDTK